MVFNWRLTQKHNHSCQYGADFMHTYKVKDRALSFAAEDWIEFWGKIGMIYKLMDINIEIADPLIFCGLPVLLGDLSKECNLGITTDLSFNVNEFIKNIIPHTLSKGIKAGFHPVSCEYETFLEKILLLQEHGFNVQVDYVCYPPQLPMLEFYSQRFRSAGVTLCAEPYFGMYEERLYPDSYSSEDMKVLEESQLSDSVVMLNKLKDQHLLHSKGRLCRAGQHGAFIDTDGEAYRCRQTCYNNSGSLGNITDNNVSLLQHPAPCLEEKCLCDSQSLVSTESTQALDKEIANIKLNYPDRANLMSENTTSKGSVRLKNSCLPLPPPYRVFFNWDIHYSCNYRCSYCFFANRWEEVARGNRYPGISHWVKAWELMREKYGECRIDISGGEPTTYPDFFPLVKEISKMHRVRFNTNLSFNVKNFISEFSGVLAEQGEAALEVNPSFHPEMISLDDILVKGTMLRESGFKVVVTYVAYPPHLRNIKNIKETIESHNMYFIIQPFRGAYRGEKYPDAYTDKERGILMQCGHQLPKGLFEHHLNRKDTTKKRKLCRMGQMYGKIYPDGNVFRCCAQGAQKTGNILTDSNFSLLKSPAYCELDCPCWKAMKVENEGGWLANWNE